MFSKLWRLTISGNGYCIPDIWPEYDESGKFCLFSAFPLGLTTIRNPDVLTYSWYKDMQIRTSGYGGCSTMIIYRVHGCCW